MQCTSRKQACSVAPLAGLAYASSATQPAFLPVRGAKTPSEKPPKNAISPAPIATVHDALSGGPVAFAALRRSTGATQPESSEAGSAERSTVTSFRTGEGGNCWERAGSAAASRVRP